MSDDRAEHADLRDRTLAFRRAHVDSQAQEWHRERAMGREALREAAATGLTGIEVPTEHGGLGLGFDAKMVMIEVLSQTSMEFAFSLVNTHNVAARIAVAGTDSHRERFLPALLSAERLGSTALTEPGAGSDFAAITTTATRVDGGWRLHGEKAWITNAAASDVILCYAQTEPGSGGAGIASFLIDGTQPGFKRLDPHSLYGGHAIGTGRFALDDYFAPDDDLFSPPGEAFKSALNGINGARTYVAVMCCAMVRASLGVAVEYGSRRHAFSRPLIEHQGLAWSLATVANQLEAGQLMADKAIDIVTVGDERGAVLPAAHAKKFCSEMAEPAISACIQAMGAEGLHDRHPMGRHLAAARIANYVDGSTEIQTERIAKSLARDYPAP